VDDCLQTGKTFSVCNQPLRSTQPGHPSMGRCSEYQWKLGHKQAHHAISVVSQCKLVSGRGLRKRRSAPSYGPCSSGRTLLTYWVGPQEFRIVGEGLHAGQMPFLSPTQWHQRTEKIMSPCVIDMNNDDVLAWENYFRKSWSTNVLPRHV